MYIIQMVLTLIRATRKTTLNCMSAVSVCHVPKSSLHTITTTTHNMYLCNRLHSLICLIHIADAKNFSNTMGFSVSQSLVLCFRNAFDITIRQTINPVSSQRRYYRLQQLELRFVLQMEWCNTHYIRAQYIETTHQCTEIKYSICSYAK